MKKTLLQALLPATLFALILGGCQKNLDSASEEGLRGGTRTFMNSSTTCQTCVSEWSDNSLAASTAANNQDRNANLTIWNDATNIYITVAGDADYEAIKVSYPYAVNNGGNVIFNDEISYNPKVNNQTRTFAIDGSKAKCAENKIVVQVEGMGGGNSRSSIISYYLNELCTSTTLTPASTTLCVGDDAQTLTATVSADEAFGGGTLTIQEEINMVWTDVASVAVTSDVKSVTYDAVTTTAGTRTFQAVYSGSTLVKGSTSDAAIVTVEDCGCEYEGNAFTGQAISCGTTREAVYTFTSEEGVSNWKIQGGLTNFTGGDAVVTVEGAASFTVNQSTPGGSSNRIISVNGTSSECSAVTIRITWNSTNSGGIITGAWSVVDAGGVELAPEVPGLSCN